MPAKRTPCYDLDTETPGLVREEGVTHTTDERAKLWPVEVHFLTGLKPCQEKVRALTSDQALQFIRARYPFADMKRTTVLDEASAAPASSKGSGPTKVKLMENLIGALLRIVPQDGSTISDKEAMHRLSIASGRKVGEVEFQAVKQKLVDSGKVRRGRGRGGPLSLIVDASPHPKQKAKAKPAQKPAPEPDPLPEPEPQGQEDMAGDMLPSKPPSKSKQAPFLAHHPQIGWVVCPSTTTEALISAGFASIAPLPVIELTG